MLKFKGEYHISKVDMYTNDLYYIDLLGSQQNFVVEYDLENILTTGSITILDKLNILSNYKLRGGESIEIEWNATDETPYRTKFIITRIEHKRVESGYSEYVFELESKWLPNLLKNYSCSLTGSINNQIKTFITQIAEIDEPMECDETNWEMHHLISGWTGFTTIDFLESRSMSKNNNSGFRFYQTATGFKFKSIVDKFNEPASRTFEKVEEIDSYSISPYFYDEIEITESSNYIKHVDGGYGSTSYIYDPFKKTYVTQIQHPKYVSSYPEVYPDTTKYFRYNYTQSHPNMDDPRLTETLRRRKQVESLFGDTTISIKVSGSIDNQIGDIVNLNVMENIRSTSGGRSIDKYMSGKYMISNVRCLCGENFLQRLTLKRLGDK